MDKREWLELERIAKNGNLHPPRGRGLRLLEKTRKEDEHPDWYEHHCECRSCLRGDD